MVLRILGHTFTESGGEYVVHNLHAIHPSDDDDFHLAYRCGVDQVAESVFHAFGDSIRTVNDEHAVWCAQFTQERRKRDAQSGFEVNRELGDLPQIDA